MLMSCFFSSRGELLKLIFKLGNFEPNELWLRYKKLASKHETKDSIIDYLKQLTEIKVLNNTKGKFNVRPSLLKD